MTRATLVAMLVLASTTAAHADDIKIPFHKRGTQTVAIAADRPIALLVNNPSAHHFGCGGIETDGLQVVVTPAAGVDVRIQAQADGHRPRPAIDRRGPGAAETYRAHVLLGGTTLRVTATAGAGDVVITWRWFDPDCHRGQGPSPTTAPP